MRCKIRAGCSGNIRDLKGPPHTPPHAVPGIPWVQHCTRKGDARAPLGSEGPMLSTPPASSTAVTKFRRFHKSA